MQIYLLLSKKHSNLTLNCLEEWFIKLLMINLCVVASNTRTWRLKQDGCHDFETSLGYIVNTRPGRENEASSNKHLHSRGSVALSICLSKSIVCNVFFYTTGTFCDETMKLYFAKADGYLRQKKSNTSVQSNDSIKKIL